MQNNNNHNILKEEHNESKCIKVTSESWVYINIYSVLKAVNRFSSTGLNIEITILSFYVIAPGAVRVWY